MIQRHIQLALITFLLPLISVAQSNYQNLLAEQKYQEAITEAQKAIKVNPKDSLAFFVAGLSHTSLSNTDEAIQNLEKAIELGLNTWRARFNLAKNHAIKGNKDSVLELLKSIAVQGGAQYKRLEDPAFKTLHDNEEFKKIKEKMVANAKPCEVDDNYRRFDFWVGEWDVFAGGSKVADSKISHSNDKCAILEDYRTLGVFAGNSITYYDKADDKWKQNWVSSGSVSHYVESEKPYDGNLQFLSEYTSPSGGLVKTRMTFFEINENTVRQLLEVSNDNGETWSINFDGSYKRKKD